MSRELLDKVLRHTLLQPLSGCRLWLRHRDAKGYGQLWFKGATRLAHRVVFELFNGPIPGRLHVLHRCDTPSCVAPEHLFLGTNTDNIADSMQKGRRQGIPRRPAKPYKRRDAEYHGPRKIEKAEHARIKARVQAGEKQSAIAKELHVHPTLVSKIVRGRA